MFHENMITLNNENIKRLIVLVPNARWHLDVCHSAMLRAGERRAFGAIRRPDRAWGSPFGLPDWCTRRAYASAVKSPGVRSAGVTRSASRYFPLRAALSGRRGFGFATPGAFVPFFACRSAVLTAFDRMTLMAEASSVFLM